MTPWKVKTKQRNTSPCYVSVWTIKLIQICDKTLGFDSFLQVKWLTMGRLIHCELKSLNEEIWSCFLCKEKWSEHKAYNQEFSSCRVCSKWVVQEVLQWSRRFSTPGQIPALTCLFWTVGKLTCIWMLSIQGCFHVRIWAWSPSTVLDVWNFDAEVQAAKLRLPFQEKK